jgi:hypothetical protein
MGGSMVRKIGLLAVAVGLLSAMPMPAATAEVGQVAASAPCSQRVGFQGVEGRLVAWDVTATTVPTVKPVTFSAGLASAKVSSTWYYRLYPDVGLSEWRGMTIRDNGLYQQTLTYRPGRPEPDVIDLRINGGWGAFTQLANSDVLGRKRSDLMYGLRNDGTLFRYHGTMSYGSATGFAAVKAMTVISETASYDTLLATTRGGGALYTIHIPVTLPMKPVVKRLRDKTWQQFESLVADRCGQSGTLLTAVDHDTDTAYLYAIGHANGASTVIRNLGKVPATFDGQTHYAMTREFKDLYGE